MQREIRRQHPIFAKYTRQWLHEVTGYAKGYLCRMAIGRSPLTRAFIERVSLKLNQPEEELFNQMSSPCHMPRGCATSALGKWLEDQCVEQHLSLRQAAIKIGLSHATIADIIRGDDNHPHPGTIQKLVKFFGGDGKQGLALEDHLLTLAGYRTERSEGEEPGEALARLLDKVSELTDSQVKIMTRFADFLVEIS